MFNSRSSIAAALSREIRSGECFADYVGYKNTEMTIKGMNSGSVGGSEWTLDCAIVRDGQLEMLFEADTFDAASFAHQGLEAMSEHKYKAVELHAQLLDIFEAEEMVRSALRSVEARIQVEHAIAESKDEEFKRRAIEARTQGLLSFGNNAVRMLESWVDVSGALLKTEASVSSINSSVTKDSFYAGERGYLPSNVELEFPERVMPSFIYYVPFQAENNVAVTEMVESQLGSQLDGGQGATSSFMLKNSGLMYEEAGTPSTTTQTELLDESASSIIDDMTTVALEINSSAGLSAGEVRRRAAEMCKTTATQSQIDELGISTGEYNALCARNSIMALTYYKNLGFKSVDHAASLAVVGAVSMGANKLTKIVGGKKKDKGLANDGKISETASTPSLLSSVLPASGKAAAKINSMFAGLANTSFIQYIAGTLITLTLGLVVVTTVIYLLPSLLFTFAMAGLVSFTLIACAVSGVMACGWVIFGGEFRHVRRSIVGAGINLVIRPMMLVVALFLSVAIVQVADMMVTSIGTSLLGNISANLDFASSMMYRLIAAIVNLVFLLWLLRSSIIEVNRATDKLIELAGGSRTGDDSERALNVAVIASSRCCK
ncbi:hypothetical protein JCM19233_6152 [Vibrio astriarenae]|nr:hypothetical protein JCM19233_6152 [Vibrio sp. C7]